MTRLPLTTMPAKPRHGEACNGCGLCCHLELCGVAVMAFKADTKPPCPALVFDTDRTYCAFVVAESKTILPKMVAEVLAIGRGCTMQDQF